MQSFYHDCWTYLGYDTQAPTLWALQYLLHRPTWQAHGTSTRFWMHCSQNRIPGTVHYCTYLLAAYVARPTRIPSIWFWTHYSNNCILYAALLGSLHHQAHSRLIYPAYDFERTTHKIVGPYINTYGCRSTMASVPAYGNRPKVRSTYLLYHVCYTAYSTIIHSLGYFFTWRTTVYAGLWYLVPIRTFCTTLQSPLDLTIISWLISGLICYSTDLPYFLIGIRSMSARYKHTHFTGSRALHVPSLCSLCHFRTYQVPRSPASEYAIM